MKNNIKLLITIFFLNQFSYGQITAQLDEIFKDYDEMPGISVSIAKDGENIYHNNFGFSNLDYDIKITDKTVFDIASSSKQFTAACIILLENQGKLSFEDPIQKHIPDFPVYKEGTIRIKHLLHHTSGLRDYLRILHARGQSWDINFNNTKALQLLKKQKELNFKPGSKFAYNNSNYLFLSILVEKISKTTFAKFAKENIFIPLGMNSTFINDNPTKIIKNRAIGYESDGDTFKRSHFFNSVTTGDGNLYTTAKDLLIWDKNFVNNKLGNATFLDKMLTVGKLNNGTNISYAGGLFLENHNGFQSIRHSGYWSGFRSLFFKIPTLDFTVVILSNNANTPVWWHIDQIINIALKDEIAKNQENNTVANVKNIKLSNRKLQKFTGNYFNYLEGNSKEILVKNDTLIYKRANGRESKLLPIDKNKFTFLVAPQVLIEFDKKYNKMKFSVNNGDPFIYKKYSPKKYTKKELAAFTGSFYSKEINTQYDIKENDNNLCITVNTDDFVCLKPEAENIFKDIEEHYGYLRFKQNINNTIISFTINDENAKNIEFIRIEG